jgi:hypothetical protein
LSVSTAGKEDEEAVSSVFDSTVFILCNKLFNFSFSLSSLASLVNGCMSLLTVFSCCGLRGGGVVVILAAAVCVFVCAVACAFDRAAVITDGDGTARPNALVPLVGDTAVKNEVAEGA